MEGFLLELADACERSGKFPDFQQQGIVLSGHRIVVDSVAAVPFVQGLYADAPTYGAGDACPPTVQRIAAYDASRTLKTDLKGQSAITPITAMPRAESPTSSSTRTPLNFPRGVISL